MIHYASSGRFQIEMTLEQAKSISHQGQCDDDVKALSKVPKIARQLARIFPGDLRQELKEYGAWDEKELADHDQNLQRFLWLAGGDIAENSKR